MLIFLCSGAAKAGNRKLSYRIAAQLEAMGIADIGDLEKLSEQHSAPASLQKRMIFINDCRSGCVNVLTHGLNKENFLFFDVSSHLHSPTFDASGYIDQQILPKLNEKWNLENSRPLLRQGYGGQSNVWPGL